MEVYTLDSLLRRTEVVDKFESLIWTERFAEIGDFELVVPSTRGMRQLLRPEVPLACNKSYRVMMVETIEDTVDSEGRAILKVGGRSLESLLQDRVAKLNLENLTNDTGWALTGTPGNIARQIFNHICRDGALDLKDKIPFLQPGSIFPPGTLPESATPISFKLPPKTVYEAIKDLCLAYDLGYRLVRNFDRSELYFDIYSGNDLTTRQTTRAPVVFAAHFDNLQNTKEFATIEKTKNVAYVFSPFGSAVVYPPDVDPDIDGFERRVLIVNVTDIEEGSDDIPGQLEQRGLEELFKARTFAAFDGELNQNSGYVYGIDYDVGDVVEMRNKDNVVSYKRVTEQIFVHDTQGERSYPTVSMDLFMATNTWLSQHPDKNWADFGLTEYWSTL